MYLCNFIHTDTHTHIYIYIYIYIHTYIIHIFSYITFYDTLLNYHFGNFFIALGISSEAAEEGDDLDMASLGVFHPQRWKIYLSVYLSLYLYHLFYLICSNV